MKKKNNKTLTYRVLYGIAYSFALLPFPILYLFSDMFYVFICHVVHYRRKIVRENIRNSFPEKNEKERRRIERKFYRHLCDYFVETLKTLTLTESEVRKRMKFENPEILNRLTKNGNSCFISLGHYANWEWVPSIGMYLAPEIVQGQVYQKIRNNAFDKLFRVIRSKFGPTSIERNDVIRTLVRHKEEGKPMVIGFLSDSRPHPNENNHWIKFLNQDTPVQLGMERIASWGGYAIVYLDLKKVKRGYYIGKFFVITADASTEPKFSIMQKYMRKLEETILSEPAYYLWSHNRWKYKKQCEVK